MHQHPDEGSTNSLNSGVFSVNSYHITDHVLF